MCEICGKNYTKPEEATQCETNCKAEKERAERLIADKQDRFDNIKKAVDNFNTDYNTKYRIIDIRYSSPFTFFHDF